MLRIFRRLRRSHAQSALPASEEKLASTAQPITQSAAAAYVPLDVIDVIISYLAPLPAENVLGNRGSFEILRARCISLHSISQVCRHWYGIGLPALYENIALSSLHLDRFIDMLKGSKRGRLIQVLHVRLIAGIEYSYAAKPTQKIRGSRVPNPPYVIEDGRFGVVMARCSNLRTLLLESVGSWGRTLDFTPLNQPQGAMRHLQRLSILNWDGSTSFYALTRAVIDGSADLPNLEDLTLTGYGNREVDHHLTSATLRLPKLRTLRLKTYIMPGGTLRAMLTSVSSTVEVLDFRIPFVITLQATWPEFPRLHTLCLAHESIMQITRTTWDRTDREAAAVLSAFLIEAHTTEHLRSFSVDVACYPLLTWPPDNFRSLNTLSLNCGSDHSGDQTYALLAKLANRASTNMSCTLRTLTLIGLKPPDPRRTAEILALTAPSLTSLTLLEPAFDADSLCAVFVLMEDLVHLHLRLYRYSPEVLSQARRSAGNSYAYLPPQPEAWVLPPKLRACGIDNWTDFVAVAPRQP